MDNDTSNQTPTTDQDQARAALRRLRLHAAAHLDVARADGEAGREAGARALLADCDTIAQAIGLTSVMS